MSKATRLKTEHYTFFKREIERMENNIVLMEKELKTDRHPVAILGNYGFTFREDIERLLEYLRATNREKTAIKFSYPQFRVLEGCGILLL